jgi:hypothetical protein
MKEYYTYVKALPLETRHISLIRVALSNHDGPLEECRDSEKIVDIVNSHHLAKQFTENKCPELCLSDWNKVNRIIALRWIKTGRTNPKLIALFKWIEIQIERDETWVKVTKFWREQAIAREELKAAKERIEKLEKTLLGQARSTG